MLQVSGRQIALWETLLPEEVTRLPQELALIDAYLDDERFIAPWRLRTPEAPARGKVAVS